MDDYDSTKDSKKKGRKDPVIVNPTPVPYEDVDGAESPFGSGDSIRLRYERLRQEDIIDYTRRNILGNYSDLGVFIRKWYETDKKDAIRQKFREHSIDLDF